LRVEFLKRLRGEKRFESVEALVEQMVRDVDDARAVAA
jgi:riboflavin kinase / FMN adenylyltransferase